VCKWQNPVVLFLLGLGFGTGIVVYNGEIEKETIKWRVEKC